MCEGVLNDSVQKTIVRHFLIVLNLSCVKHLLENELDEILQLTLCVLLKSINRFELKS